VLTYLGLKDKIPADPPSPGRSYAPVLEGRALPSKWDNTVFYEFETVRAIRTDRWKYVERLDEGPRELYDLAADPGELHNLADQPDEQSMQNRLRDQLHQFFDRYADPKFDLARGGTSKAQFLISEHPVVVRASYVDRSFTLDRTTARLDGPHVRLMTDDRTIAGWKNADDRAVWQLSRVRPGKYQIEAVWSLASSDENLPADRLVIEIDDTPLTEALAASGGDRVRTTGGWDQYKSFTLGTIELTAGDHQLTFHPSTALQNEWLRLRQLKLVPQAN